MPEERADHVGTRRLVLLFLLFFLICLGLGYPILNRIDWQRAPGGLTDLQEYAKLVTAPPSPDLEQHVQFRVLVPYVARPFYRLALGHSGSWDPVMFGLLVANSLFVSGTVTVLLTVALQQTGNYSVALGSALLYLLNFVVSNLRLYGFVDSGEAFCLILVLWSLMRERYFLLPVWAVFGSLAKESFVPFLIAFTATWWTVWRARESRTRTKLIWVAASWGVSLIAMAALQWNITGILRSPMTFGLGLHHGSEYLAHFVHLLRDRNLWYTFIWLAPLGMLRVRRLPMAWRAATVATCICALVLDAYYGGQPGTMARALFTLAAPMLSVSAAWLLFEPRAVHR